MDYVTYIIPQIGSCCFFYLEKLYKSTTSILFPRIILFTTTFHCLLKWFSVKLLLIARDHNVFTSGYTLSYYTAGAHPLFWKNKRFAWFTWDKDNIKILSKICAKFFVLHWRWWKTIAIDRPLKMPPLPEICPPMCWLVMYNVEMHPRGASKERFWKRHPLGRAGDQTHLYKTCWLMRTNVHLATGMHQTWNTHTYIHTYIVRKTWHTISIQRKFSWKFCIIIIFRKTETVSFSYTGGSTLCFCRPTGTFNTGFSANSARLASDVAQLCSSVYNYPSVHWQNCRIVQFFS